MTRAVRTCKVCSNPKPLTEFYRQGTYPDGRERRRWQCKRCFAERYDEKRIAWRTRNQSKLSARRRAWYAGRTDEQKEARRATERERYKGGSAYHSVRTRRYRKKLKTDLIAGYGGKCRCCGENEPDFLTIDHPDGDGKEHRIAVGGKNRGTTMAVYRDLRDRGYPPGYRLLCFNCNIAISLFGTCPHQRA